MRRFTIGSWVATCASLCTLVIVSLPMITLLAHVPQNGWLTTDSGVFSALITSLQSTAVTMVFLLVLGLPLAYQMARKRSLWFRIVNKIIYVPLVMPPLVIGLLLMYIFGPYTWIGQAVSGLSGSLVNTLVAVIIAQFYEEVPYFVLAAEAAFSDVLINYEKTAYALGKSPWQTFFHITLPLALPGLLNGFAMAFARSIGAFGAVIVIAYYPHTLPVAMWIALQEQGLPAALPLALILILLSLPLTLLILLGRRRTHA